MKTEKNIPQTPQERIDWYRTPVEKPVMKELLKRSDAKGLQQCLSMIALSIATGTLAYYSFNHWPWYVTVLAVYFHGMCYFFHGAHAAIHDLSHGTPFKSKGLNAFFYGFFGFISWTSTVRYRASHMQHHQLTTHTGRDLEVVLPWLPSRMEWLGYWTFDWKLFSGNLDILIRHSFGIIKGEWEHHMFAGIPFFNLKRLRKAIEHDIPEYDGLLATWKKLLPTMRRQRTDPSFVVIPKLLSADPQQT